MAQKKNGVTLSSTALAKLQKLVEAGEYCSLDDAASHIITTVLGSTPSYSLKSDQKITKPAEIAPQSPEKPNLAQELRRI